MQQKDASHDLSQSQCSKCSSGYRLCKSMNTDSLTALVDESKEFQVLVGWKVLEIFAPSSIEDHIR